MVGLKKILIIDDEPSITEIVGQFSCRLGYSPDFAHSGAEAIEKLKRDCYWAVFCDLLMPGLGGLDVYEKLREFSSRSSRRFVLLTGTVLDEAEHNAVTCNDIIVLHKPFNFEGISRTLLLLENIDQIGSGVDAT
jgi:CheY-like chemotaxis protein